MPIDKSLISEKLQKIDDYIGRIENMHFSEDQFLENIDYQDLLTFRLQQAVELCVDITTHIIAALKLEKPETARSSFEVLVGHDILNKELADKMMLAVSFRNIAVHGYEDFDFKQLFGDYKQDLESLKSFVAKILKYLEE